MAREWAAALADSKAAGSAPEIADEVREPAQAVTAASFANFGSGGGAAAPGDEGRPPIDQAILDAPGRVVPGIAARYRDRATVPPSSRVRRQGAFRESVCTQKRRRLPDGLLAGGLTAPP